MTRKPKPLFDPEKMKTAVDNLAKAMENMSTTMVVSNAMTAVWSGNLDRARDELRKLPAAKRRDVALSALSLASLAETAAKEDPEP